MQLGPDQRKRDLVVTSHGREGATGPHLVRSGYARKANPGPRHVHPVPPCPRARDTIWPDTTFRVFAPLLLAP